MEQNQANLQNADDSKNAGPSPGHPQSELSLRRSVSNEIAAGVQVDDVNPDISKEPEPAERPLAPINPTVSEPVNLQHENERTDDALRQGEASNRVEEEEEEEEEEDITANKDWSDPLRSPAKESFAEKESGTSEVVPAPENSDSAHSAKQQHILVDGEKNEDVLRVQSPTTATARRVSHLRLDLKSSQPWDTDGPLGVIGQTKLENHQTGSAAQPKLTVHSKALKPKSSYYFGPPPEDSAFGTPPIGHIGVHYPREMVRIERDYSGGELPQFAAIYPLEFEGRISPTQFLESINAINEILISAYSLRYSFVDNALAIFSLQLSKLILKTHYEKEMERLDDKIKELNEALFNPVGLNILWPRKVAFLLRLNTTDPYIFVHPEDSKLRR